MSSPAPDPRALNRLRWRCRRGLLENDLLIERFFARHGAALSTGQVSGLERLMDLPDPDLLDLLLRRTELDPSHDRPDVRDVLELLRSPPPTLQPIPNDPHPKEPEE
jgi:antitoxin CptB